MAKRGYILMKVQEVSFEILLIYFKFFLNILKMLNT